jgi:hypothetical protein
MANEHSHIWGSGMLDPSADYASIRPENVRAVRGKMTEQVLRSKYGLIGPVALGDPGLFVNELPEVAEFARRNKIVRRTAVIPHYAMVSNETILRLARDSEGDVINPRLPVFDFLREILASEVVISQSLHGLIFAEALGKPHVWISHDFSPLWTFKFLDWFSNTVDPPLTPFPLDVSVKVALAAARLARMNVDRASLRASFPLLTASERRPGESFRISRARGPLKIKVSPDRRIANTPAFDCSVFCKDNSEYTLRLNLNEICDNHDEMVSGFLIFDSELFGALSVDEIDDIVKLATDFPDPHYFGICGKIDDMVIPEPDASIDKTFILTKWNDALNWSGVLFLRNLRDFSFSAPGVALVRKKDLGR